MLLDGQPARADGGSACLHIGLYAPAWPPGSVSNGIVTYVQVLRDELKRLGHRVSVFASVCSTDESESIFQVVESPRSARWSAIRARLGVSPAALYGFGRVIADTVLRRHAVDPLDVFEMEESFGWAQDVQARLPFPTVVKLHGPAFLSLLDGPPSPDRVRRIRLEGRALRKAKTIVSPSRSTLLATAARYALRGESMIAVANPIATSGISMHWQFDPGHVDDILFVGRFDHRKGGDAILQVFAAICASRPAARLTFVGPDVGIRLASGELQHFDAYVRAHLAPDVATRIRFLGSRPGREVQQLRLLAGVTVLATRWESFGYVVAEAMNQGCPVAAFDVDGVNELVVHGRTGLLAPLDDIAGLATSVCRVLDDPALAQSLGACAREAVAASCGAERVALQMLAVYRDAVERTGARAPRPR